MRRLWLSMPPRKRRAAAWLLLGALALSTPSLVSCAARYQPMGRPIAQAVMGGTGFVAADGYYLPVRSWMPEDGPPRAVIVALHGFNDYSNAFAGAGTYLARHGIATYAYDQRGFGATAHPGIWPGAATLVSDLRNFTAQIHRRHPGLPVYLMGESMGGAVVMTALTTPPPPGSPGLDVEGTVLVAPAVWGREVMNPLHRVALWLGMNTVPWMEVRAPKELKIVPSDNIEMLRALGRDPLVIKRTRIDSVYGLTNLMGEALAAAGRLETPALVLYGAKEQVLPPKPVARALELLPPGRHTVAVYPDGYHMLLRDLQGEVVLRDIASWITNPVSTLPSGFAQRPSQGQVAEKPGTTTQ